MVKRARIVASSDEDDAPDSKKQHVNGHGSSSPESSKKPDDETLEKFLYMWAMVYPFVEKMVGLGNFFIGKLTSLCL